MNDDPILAKIPEAIRRTTPKPGTVIAHESVQRTMRVVAIEGTLAVCSHPYGDKRFPVDELFDPNILQSLCLETKFFGELH